MKSLTAFKLLSIHTTVNLLINTNHALCFSSFPLPSHIQYHQKLNTGKIKNHHKLEMSNDNDSPSNAAIELVSKKLSSSLANLDSTFQKIRRRKGSVNGESEWTRLDINDEDDDDISNANNEYVYLLPPPYTEKPSCVIIFIGGAVLGQFPHISYSELLQRLSTRMNAAILAIPYQVQLDHFNLAKQCATTVQKALWKCQDDYSWDLQEKGKIPLFTLSHSLGSKLLFIIMAANTKWMLEDVQSIGFMSFNNFSFVQSISMLRTMVEQIRGTKEATNNNIMDTIFDMTQQITTGLDIEFYPSPEAMEELIRSKVDQDFLEKCRFFSFEDDDLDCTQSIPCDNPLEVSKLPGNHLTPVYWKLSLDDLPVEEVKDIASQFTNGFRSASFGDEESLDGLVDEVYNWMIGKGPSVRGGALPSRITSGDS